MNKIDYLDPPTPPVPGEDISSIISHWYLTQLQWTDKLNTLVDAINKHIEESEDE